MFSCPYCVMMERSHSAQNLIYYLSVLSKRTLCFLWSSVLFYHFVQSIFQYLTGQFPQMTSQCNSTVISNITSSPPLCNGTMIPSTQSPGMYSLSQQHLNKAYMKLPASGDLLLSELHFLCSLHVLSPDCYSLLNFLIPPSLKLFSSSDYLIPTIIKCAHCLYVEPS